MTERLDQRQFEQLVEEAFDSLSERLLAFVDNVVFVVEDWPDHETLDALDIVERDGLLGLYQGNPLTERDSQLSVALPDRVVLYQRPIEQYAYETGLAVAEVIRDTLLHEVGHHFGLDEADLALLEDDL